MAFVHSMGVEANVLPNLFIPGAGKSGTSSLHELLNQHPQIHMSATKEPHFWTNEAKYPEMLSQYLKLFEEGKHHIYRGESSTGYMVFDGFIERIKKDLNDVKFIFLLRNPVDRAYSHYWWMRGMGYEERTFREAVMHDFDQIPCPSRAIKGVGYKYYFQFGLYGKWLSRFYRHFAPEDIHIVFSEDLHEDRHSALQACFTFLNLEPVEKINPVHTNATVILRDQSLYKHLKKGVTQNRFISVAKRVLPRRTRRHLARAVFGGLKKRASTDGYPPMDPLDRIWLMDCYQEDLTLLNKVSERTCKRWVDP